MKKLLNEIMKKGNYEFISDNGDWEYERIGIGELNGKVYRWDMEEGEDTDIVELKDGLSLEDVLNEGIKLGFFEKVVIEDWGVNWYLDLEKEVEMMDWLGGLDK